MTIICRNDDLRLSLTGLDCLQIDSEDFILFAEINQILLKTSLNFYVHTFSKSSHSSLNTYYETEIPSLTRISLYAVLTNLVNTNFA